MLALKRLGLPLARIGELLAGRLASLDAVLAVQEQALAVRRDEAERALTALRAARARLAAGEALSMDDLTTLTQETTVTEKMTPEEWRETFEPLWTKHLSPQELEQLAARKDVGMRAFGDQNGVSDAWDRLIAEAETLRAKGDPGSPEAFDLVARWKVLQDAFTGGDPQIAAKTAAMWKEAMADPAVSAKLPMGPGVWEFVAEASRRKRESEGG